MATTATSGGPWDTSRVWGIVCPCNTLSDFPQPCPYHSPAEPTWVPAAFTFTPLPAEPQRLSDEDVERIAEKLRKAVGVMGATARRFTLEQLRADRAQVIEAAKQPGGAVVVDDNGRLRFTMWIPGPLDCDEDD